ncbi:hypothetical protein ABZ023_01420 [Streptomyces sp. NPDC006367]|uniref:hypothetical protein n=1 Tax=unclassified Streptomyces TaxID=2593676 RepID=UPI0033AD023D
MERFGAFSQADQALAGDEDIALPAGGRRARTAAPAVLRSEEYASALAAHTTDVLGCPAVAEPVLAAARG